MKTILLKDDHFITFKPFSYQTAIEWRPLKEQFKVPKELIQAETFARVQLALVEYEIEKYLLNTQQIAYVADG